MINDIVDGISIKLNQVFGDEVEFYSESMEQGLKEPCFFILLIADSATPLLGTRTKKNHIFDIHYFPSSKQGKNEELFRVSEQLFDTLEWIELVNGDILHGTKRSAQIVDGILHFFVNYNLILTKTKEVECLEGLELETTVKPED